ncbi:alpha/beta fold hydrolase [Leptolyngbya sp. FACHB-402]|nr:alpha/beta fold hydrolase [Leptolyngbya sp. FACHB-161]MBD2376588.1 alpha/beta fold hydrolase [Leptolyngbya sp. FACHB-238]MBD2400860.1 alpha/beta fold hydrolase [Leptolyngbya sp. FACHB-239]MBD2407572.1 alpha/beta fold hydrolase [Leptolyngbya sp. FACHB-402]
MKRFLKALLLNYALVPIVVLAQAASGQTQQLTVKPIRNTQIPCPTPINPDEIEGKTTICGVVTVPENYSKPNGRQIELTYALLRSKSLTPQPDPLIVLHGGPGGSDISALSFFTQAHNHQRQTRDVILFDQRGSQYSGDLACSQTLNIIAQVLTVPGSPWKKKFETFATKFKNELDPTGESLAQFALCSNVLELHGNDLTQYNTSNNAKDVVSLASALGYDQVNLYGISYGTYLAMRVMRDHPQRVHSVILDSTIPPNIKKYEANPLDLEVVTLNLIEDCQKDAACDRAYPNLKARTIALLKSLDKKPIPIPKQNFKSDKPIPESVTPDAFADLITSLNTDADNRIRNYVPLIISELEQGVTTTYVGVVSGSIFKTPATKLIPIGEPQNLIAKSDKLRAEARKLLTQRIQLAESQRPSRKWVKQVLDAIETLPEADRTIARGNFYGVGFLKGQPRDRNTLIASIAEIFPKQMREPLTQPLRTLPDAEIRHTYEIISGILTSTSSVDHGIAQGSFRSMDCQDMIAGNDPARSAAVSKAMEMPELGRARVDAGRAAYAICQFWSVKPAAFAGVLKSNIPTLVLQSRYDSQTPTLIGKEATAGLANGTYLEFPNGGHGALLFSQCARDAGAAFVNNPARPPKAECRAELKPKFVLPRQ